MMNHFQCIYCGLFKHKDERVRGHEDPKCIECHEDDLAKLMDMADHHHIMCECAVCDKMHKITEDLYPDEVLYPKEEDER